MIQALLPCLLALACAAGCAGTEDGSLLTPAETQELQANLEASLEVQQRLAEYAFAAARGDVDISGYVYDAPTDANGWTGTIDVPAGTALPFGTGAAQITFRVIADGVPVDPYAADLGSATDVQIDVLDATFTGTSLDGAPLSASGAFSMDTLVNAADSATAVVNGAWTVVHDGYEVALDATDVRLDLDLVLDEVTSMTGTIAGTVDIPDLVADAAFAVEGLGDSLQIRVDVATTLDYVLGLSDLF